MVLPAASPGVLSALRYSLIIAWMTTVGVEMLMAETGIGHLLVGVRARIAGIGDQRLDLAVLDVERVQNRFLKKKTRRRKTVGGLVMGADWCGCKLQTLQTWVCSRTLGECRARAPRIAIREGRTPFASGRSPRRHRCPEDS